MSTAQERFDDAMFDFSMADYDAAIAKLEVLLSETPDHLDARLALGMAYCRLGNYEAALREGHKAEKLRPHEQLVHTNLSLFYMKAGDKKTAEHHGLQARIASWRHSDEAGSNESDTGLEMAKPAPAPMKFTGKLPATPWKANKPVANRPAADETSWDDAPNQTPADESGSESNSHGKS